MGKLSYAQLEGLWLNTAKGTKYATRAWAALMAAIAEAESGGNPDATNPTDNNGTQTSWGLWQISLGNHVAPAANWADPAVNAQLALGKLQGQGLGAWGTYTSGAYKAYMNGATTPDPSVPGNPAALTDKAQAASGSDCLYGNTGIPGTSIFNDLFGGGNIGQFCLLTRSQLRGMVGVALVAGGVAVMGLGLGLAFYEIGSHSKIGAVALSLASRGVVRGFTPKAPPAGKPAPRRKQGGKPAEEGSSTQ